MSGLVPFPPPLPPPIPERKAPCDRSDIKKLVLHHLNQSSYSDHDFATYKRQLLSRLNCAGNGSDFISYLKPVQPVLQDGPKCGLVAMCMAAQLLYDLQLDVEAVYERAHTKGFTKQGEMFSAAEMASLAGDMLRCQATVVRGEDRRAQILDAMCQGHAVLVPYDRDSNNEPCTRGGTKAHWALLTGVVIQMKEGGLSEQVFSRIEQDWEWPNLHRVKNSKTLSSLPESVMTSSPHVYVYAYQGKSQRPQLWEMSHLLESNAQLVTPDPYIVENRDQFRVPECGVEEGLSNQIVILGKERSL